MFFQVLQQVVVTMPRKLLPACIVLLCLFFSLPAWAASFAELHEKGRTAMLDKKMQTAVFYLEQAMAIKKDQPQLLQDLGYVYTKLNRLDEALLLLKKASDMTPKDMKIQQDIGAALLKMKRWEDAVAVLEKVVARVPDHPIAHFNIGLAYMALQKKNLAQAQYEILLKLDPRLAKDLFQFIYL